MHANLVLSKGGAHLPQRAAMAGNAAPYNQTDSLSNHNIYNMNAMFDAPDTHEAVI